MTQYDFIKKFLPDHEEKLKQLIPDFDSQSGNMEYLSIMDFCDIYFEEALKSFMNKVCEEQRKICANDAKLYYNFYFSSFPTPEKIEKVVKNSTTPTYPTYDKYTLEHHSIYNYIIDNHIFLD